MEDNKMGQLGFKRLIRGVGNKYDSGGFYSTGGVI